MKKNFVTHLIALSIATAIFVGCSKDESIVNNREANASMNSNAGKMAPDPNGGTITGTFNTTPVTVDVSVVKGELLVVGEATVSNQGFTVNYIPPGMYDVRILYTNAANSQPQLKIIENITIRAKEIIDLGTINLE